MNNLIYAAEVIVHTAAEMEPLLAERLSRVIHNELSCDRLNEEERRRAGELLEQLAKSYVLMPGFTTDRRNP